MPKCPAPWCRAELDTQHDHPDHRAMMEDPRLDYIVVMKAGGGHDVYLGKKKAAD